MIFNSAYMLINKAIPSTGGPYTVRFYDDDNNLIQTDANVPQYGTAHCTLLDGSVKNGLYFKGWNPSPTNIIRDLDCYPVRGDYIIRHEETHDSWETICADCGAHYPLGTYKSLVINIPAYQASMTARRVCFNGNWMDDGYYTEPNFSNDIQANSVNLSIDMVKVAEGEDGSTSTWLSTGVINLYSANVTRGSVSNVMTFVHGVFRSDETPNPFYGEGIQFDWDGCAARQWMNSALLNSLPDVVKLNIKEVTKAYATSNVIPVNENYRGTNRGQSSLEKTSMDKIWIPSVKELHTLFSSASNWSTYNSIEESTGIDYSSVYTPTYPKFMTRSLWVDSNNLNPLFLSGNTLTNIDQGTGNAPFGFCL